MGSDELYMRRCIELAANGLGKVSTNPMVGCVIVRGDRIIGEGFHMAYGGPHAEVHAIRSVPTQKLLEDATLYVNLEPCSHTGKTPPCTGLIIEKKIPRVVISNPDPFPAVSGRGIQALMDAGIEVTTGILAGEGQWLNRRFFTFHREQRPYVILKWAQTLDGFIDIDRNDPGARVQWITNDRLKNLVHKWRTEEDAVMVGHTTAINDNPQLNVREWHGRNPVRVVLDEKMSLPAHLRVFDDTSPTLVLTGAAGSPSGNTIYITIDFHRELVSQICNTLYLRGIQSLIVEGGREMLETWINAYCWDEARILTGNRYFGKGLAAPDINGRLLSSCLVDGERVSVLLNPGKYHRDISPPPG